MVLTPDSSISAGKNKHLYKVDEKKSDEEIKEIADEERSSKKCYRRSKRNIWL